MDDISLCAGEDLKGGEDIDLCPENDIELCTDCPELTIEGTQDPVVGSTYVTTGGSGTLTFSFDQGTISQAGIITAINSCSAGTLTGTISVSDSCATGMQTAQIQVRLPGGTWTDSSPFCAVSGSFINCSGDYVSEVGYGYLASSLTSRYRFTLCVYNNPPAWVEGNHCYAFNPDEYVAIEYPSDYENFVTCAATNESYALRYSYKRIQVYLCS